MYNIAVLLHDLYLRGVRVRLTDNGPVLTGRKAALTDNDLAALKANRDEIVRLITLPQRRVVLLSTGDVLAEGTAKELSLEAMRQIAASRPAAGEWQQFGRWVRFVTFTEQEA